MVQTTSESSPHVYRLSRGKKAFHIFGGTFFAASCLMMITLPLHEPIDDGWLLFILMFVGLVTACFSGLFFVQLNGYVAYDDLSVEVGDFSPFLIRRIAREDIQSRYLGGPGGYDIWVFCLKNKTKEFVRVMGTEDEYADRWIASIPENHLMI